MDRLRRDIIRTILYYDIFHYPLRAEEVFAFLPSNSITLDTLRGALTASVKDGTVYTAGDFFSVDQSIDELVQRRLRMERFAARRWRIARAVGRIIALFPFVRGCFITGTLAKNLSSPTCDIDYFVVTAVNRLWIARTILILFKKLFLLNSKKYFCLNYFATEATLYIQDQNLFTATEIAYAKPLISDVRFEEFRSINGWIRSYFPNWTPESIEAIPVGERRSIVARFLEFPFRGSFGDRIDVWFMHQWEKIWRRRYPDLTDAERDFLFRVRRNVSKAHPPDFQTRIMNAYELNCKRFGIASREPAD